MKHLVLHMMRWLLTSTPFLILVAVGIGVFFFLLSFKTGIWHWFSRSGALITSIGAVLSTRGMLRIGIDGILNNTPNIEVVNRIHNPIDASTDKQTKCDVVAAYWGFWMVAIGTITWAYGDLLVCMLKGMTMCGRMWVVSTSRKIRCIIAAVVSPSLGIGFGTCPTQKSSSARIDRVVNLFLGNLSDHNVEFQHQPVLGRQTALGR